MDFDGSNSLYIYCEGRDQDWSVLVNVMISHPLYHSTHPGARLRWEERWTGKLPTLTSSYWPSPYQWLICWCTVHSNNTFSIDSFFLPPLLSLRVSRVCQVWRGPRARKASQPRKVKKWVGTHRLHDGALQETGTPCPSVVCVCTGDLMMFSMQAGIDVLCCSSVFLFLTVSHSLISLLFHSSRDPQVLALLARLDLKESRGIGWVQRKLW